MKDSAPPTQSAMPRPGLTPLELVVLGGCGHMPSIEAPQEYRHAVTEFLRG